jgi:hypothetical protein
MSDSKMRRTENNKKQDGHFKKVNIKHGQPESVRAVFDPIGKVDKEDIT